MRLTSAAAEGEHVTMRGGGGGGGAEEAPRILSHNVNSSVLAMPIQRWRTLRKAILLKAFGKAGRSVTFSFRQSKASLLFLSLLLPDFNNRRGFLDAFAELWKASISFMSVFFVRSVQLGSHWTDFHEIWYLCISFRKPVEKIQVSLKLDKNNGYFAWKPICIFDHISLNSS
jgi:hypothetical protein